MSTKISKLKDKDGNEILPKTLASCVTTSDDKTIEQKFSELDAKDTEQDSSITSINSSITSINESLSIKEIDLVSSGLITSSWTIGSAYAFVVGNIVSLCIDIRNSDGLSTSSRLNNAINLSKYAPKALVFFPIVTQTSVGSYMDKVCDCLIDSNGAMFIDNFSGATVKEMEITITYISDNV